MPGKSYRRRREEPFDLIDLSARPKRAHEHGALTPKCGAAQTYAEHASRKCPPTTGPERGLRDRIVYANFADADGRGCWWTPLMRPKCYSASL